MLEIFIPGNVPSLKNGKIATANRAIVSSYSIRRWQKQSKEAWISNREVFKQAVKGLHLPLFIHLTFARKTDNLWDFVAPVETIADEMVKYEWIWDDNIYEVFFVPGKPYIDKKKPGTHIKVCRIPPKYEFI